ncbi:ATP-dependent DNA ligase [Streptomyces sp. NBC_01381]|uniref:ATP-dependent DNA ligase n=1 Tax=Streptomyces sp. NBC_01381 TaxID=2903845 RepID=UPI0022516197|nr:ATP-dependent DNA ligase [Streptomyces sp. NBC_01381]MCX4673615.1 ATP-dependent DNA ligase [Streptomyces sp. NBC_01381]
MSWTLPDPMLAAAVHDPALPPDWAAEPKWDGYRALLARYADGRVVLRSRRGTDMTAAFPEIASAAAALPGDTALDGELVVWENDRLAFERLQGRLNRTAAAAANIAAVAPAHFVAFDLLRQGEDLTRKPYASRRAALERLFTDYELGPPWTLCPSTTDPRQAAEWLTWSAVGMEGLVFKRLAEPYLPGRRGWRKYRSRQSTEAVIGAVSGSLAAPATVLLGRLDRAGQLQFAGRTTVLPRPLAQTLAGQLTPARHGHPWTGWSFSAGWGTNKKLTVQLVDPLLVAEIAADVSLDTVGRWRHPVRLLRIRDDLTPAEVPQYGTDA